MLLTLALLFAATAAPAAAATADAMPSSDRVLALVRARYAAHRPVPPFETYLLTRTQLTVNGGLDEPNSYSRRFWVRNADRAALTRSVRSDGAGALAFDRPAFNEARDPGPPTADMFEPAPARPHPVAEVPTPEPVYSALPSGVPDPDYRVESLAVEGDRFHLHLSPLRDADRNRLREIFADRTTYELRELVAVDKLFISKGPVYPVTFTITMGAVNGIPVVTALRGVVGGNYNDDGKVVDYLFTNIAFPPSLPDWYFDPRTYGRHQADGPH